MKKKTLLALTGAGALASLVVGGTPQLKGAVRADSTNASESNARGGGARLQADNNNNNDDKKSKKPKKVKSPKKFKA